MKERGSSYYSLPLVCSSTNLDGWNDYQIRMMKNGGNKAASLGLKVPIGSGTGSKEKYSTRQAQEYKQRLKGMVEREIGE